jgi:hypothetical protein
MILPVYPGPSEFLSTDDIARNHSNASYIVERGLLLKPAEPWTDLILGTTAD